MMANDEEHDAIGLGHGALVADDKARMRAVIFILAVMAIVPVHGQTATNAAPEIPATTNAAPVVDVMASTNASPVTDANGSTNVAPTADVSTLTNAADFVDPLLGPEQDTPDPSGKKPLKRFDGHVSLTTGTFIAPDGWELRWHSDQLLSIGVLRPDNTVVAGTTGRTVGSLYVPQGGTYRLRVKASESVPWDIQVVVIRTAPTDLAFYEPTPGPEFKPLDPATNVETPAVVVPPAPAPPVAAPVVREMSPEQRQALVTIKGDRLQGTGFFMKHGKDTVLITTQQLLANNPNWQILAANGSVVQVTKIRGASDRDVAMLDIKDFGYATLDQGDPMNLKPGDMLLTSGPTFDSPPPVKVGSLGLQHILTRPLRPMPGSPLVLATSGRVVGVIAVGPQILPSSNFNDQSFAERDAKSAGSTGGYALRFDNVPAWEACDAAQLQTQALFLDVFRQHSRALDAYLNGGGAYNSTSLWKADDKIKSANDTFVQYAAGAGSAQRTQALQALLFELGVVADTDMDQIQQPQNFYGYQRTRARDETVYRKELKAQIDQYSSDPKRFGDTASSNNGG